MGVSMDSTFTYNVKKITITRSPKIAFVFYHCFKVIWKSVGVIIHYQSAEMYRGLIVARPNIPQGRNCLKSVEMLLMLQYSFN